MPELPEVETTVRDLKTKVLKRTFVDVWTDFRKIIKKPNSFKDFRKQIKGKKIISIRRRGKNIIFDLSNNLSLLVHQKMTGHLLYGTWGIKHGIWIPADKGPLQDPVNRFIHLIFWLDNKKMLALSDLRKFAKVELWGKNDLEGSQQMMKLGPEPLEKSFTLKNLKNVFKEKQGRIKQVLMNQEIIAGIGNIYSDEILWEARVNPLKKIDELSAKDIKEIYGAIKEILGKAIKLEGDSMSDYRLITGEKGKYQNFQKVYQQEGRPCKRRDGGIIKRIKTGGRSARFCPICQKLTG